MSTSPTTPGPAIRDWVIDVDTHISEPGDLWTQPAPGQVQGPGAAHRARPEDGDRDVAHRRRADLPARRLHRGGGLARAVPARRRATWTRCRRRRGMRARGSTTWTRSASGRWRSTRTSAASGARRSCSLEGPGADARLRARLQRLPDRLDLARPAPLHPDPRHAVLGRRRLGGGDRALRGARPQGRAVHRRRRRATACRSSRQPHWDPIWAAAQACDLPVSFHIGSGTLRRRLHARAHPDDRRRPHERVRRHRALPRQRQAAHRPALLRRPAALPEAEVPLRRERDRLHPVRPRGRRLHLRVQQGAAQRTRSSTLKPSEYFHRQVYGCYFFEELAPRELLDTIGEDNILFETDYPHPVCLYGNVREKIDARARRRRRPRCRRKVLWENAAKLYKIAPPDRPPPLPVG